MIGETVGVGGLIFVVTRSARKALPLDLSLKKKKKKKKGKPHGVDALGAVERDPNDLPVVGTVKEQRFKGLVASAARGSSRGRRREAQSVRHFYLISTTPAR